MSDSSRSYARWREALIPVSLLVVAAFAMLQVVRPAHRESAFAMPGPAGVAIDALRGPASPLQVLAAQMAALDAVGAAIQAGIDAAPKVPWGRYGLADVEIKRQAIRFDAGRDRYVATLADGGLAILSFDPKIQRRVTDAMKRASEPGEATVVIEPSTGRVLALADDGSPEQGVGLARRSYAWAASTFKVVTAAALFEHSDVGVMTQTCFHGGGDGFTEDMLRDNAELDTLCVSFQRAMALSANVVFGKLADRNLTPEQLLDTAQKLGFNALIPFEMSVESSLLELPEGRSEFAMAAAGFRASRMSPLHGALIQATIANNGIMMVPSMVDEVLDAEGNVVWRHTPVEWRRSLTERQATMLRDVQATTCVNGTARADFAARPGWPASIQVWGKTGTLFNRRSDGSLPPNPLTYRWFTGIAQRGEREVAVSSLVVQSPQWQIRGAYLASEAVLAGLPAAE